MAKSKRNKSMARIAILAGTALAGVGIWSAVSQATAPSSSKQSNPSNAVVETTVLAPKPSFSASDDFLTQRSTQTLPGGSSSVARQSTSAQTFSRPRLRTRGS